MATDTGTIQVHSFIGDRNRNNSNTLSNIFIANCSGGKYVSAGGAGGISIAFMSNMANENNVNVLTNITVKSCQGGGWNEYGGAGGISVSYNTFESSGSVSNDYGSSGNTNSFLGVSISDCIGGSSLDYGTIGGTAGGISVRYSAPNKGSCKSNTNTFAGVWISKCVDAGTGLFGGGAGGISVSYYVAYDLLNNVNNFLNTNVASCKGGINRGVTVLKPFSGQSNQYLFNKRVYLGGAGAISITFYAVAVGGQLRDNVNSILNTYVADCVGGSNTYVAGAGGISISHFGEATGNSHEFCNVSLSRCAGGVDIDVGAGAGAAAIGYHSPWKPSDNNIHAFANVSANNCVGGDTSQGAGGLGVFFTDTSRSFNNSISIRNSVIIANTGGGAASNVHGLGVAGGVGISLCRSRLSFLQISDSLISDNRLASGCSGLGTRTAGGLSIFGANTSLRSVVFANNSSPAQAGALQCTSNIELEDITFSNNSSPFFETAILQNVSTRTTVFQFQSIQLGLQANLEPQSSYEMTCPVGSQVTSLESSTQFACTVCPEGRFNMEHGTYVNGSLVKQCKDCPSRNSDKVFCSGQSISSQPGYFVYADLVRATKTYEPRFAACPNFEACKGTYTFNSSHDTSLSLQCDPGYEGMLCTSCTAGEWYSPKLDALTCETCPNRGLMLLCDPLVAVALYVCAILSCLKKSDDYGQDDDPAQSVLSGSLKILMSHGTALSVVAQVDWSWESTVKHWLHAPTAPSGSILDLDVGCLWGWGYEAQVYFDVLYPIGKGLMAVVVFLLVRLFSRVRYSFWPFATTGLYLFAGKSVAFLLTSFPCFKAEQEVHRMVFDPAVSCWAHSSLVVLSSIAIVVFGGLTVHVLGHSFWQRRDVITNPTAFTPDEVRDTHVDFGFLFRDYK